MTALRIVALCGCGLLAGSSLRGAAVVSVGQSFTGSTYGVDSLDVPPDSNGAAGPSHFVEFINGRFSVYSKITGARVQTMTDQAFWSGAGFTLPSGWQLSDPRTLFDPTVQRWFAVQIDVDPSGAVNTNEFLIAISATADPTGPWTSVAIPSDPGGNNFADFPTLGIDAQGIALAGDMFDATGAAVGSTLVSIPKVGLLGSAPSAAGMTWFGIMSYASRGHILQPAVCLDGSAGSTVLGAAGLGFNFTAGQFQTNTALIGSIIQNENIPGAARLGAAQVRSVAGYTAPPNPMQPDGSNTLDDGDARFSAKAVRVNGVLYAVHATGFNNLAALRWYRLDAASFEVLEIGTISDPNLNLFYPSIAANTNGTVVIGFNGASPTTYVSSYAAVGQTVNGVTTFGNLLLLKAGVASYHVPGSTRSSRWGDYSATSVDPVDPARFWTIQAYPSSATSWSTQITELITSPTQPALTITRQGGNVRVSWPLAAASYQLQSISALSSTALWSPVTQSAATNGDFISLLLPTSAPAQFFRLQQLALALAP